MNPWLVEVVGVLAYVLNVIGNVLLARKVRAGWGVRLASIVLWGVYAAFISSLAMALNAATFFGINCYGLWKWRGT